MVLSSLIFFRAWRGVSAWCEKTKTYTHETLFPLLPLIGSLFDFLPRSLVVSVKIFRFPVKLGRRDPAPLSFPPASGYLSPSLPTFWEKSKLSGGFPRKAGQAELRGQKQSSSPGNSGKAELCSTGLGDVYPINHSRTAFAALCVNRQEAPL